MSRLTRRQFIGRTALIAGTLPMIAWDDACQRANVTTSMLEKFRKSIDGDVLYPIDPGYWERTVVWNARFQHAPMMFVLPANEADVQKAIQFSKSNGIRLSPRGGGHNYCGWSTCDGMVIDFRNMAHINVESDASVAHIGPGALLFDMYQKLWCDAQCSLPGGTCPTVGLAGFTLGGGFGLYSRAWGLMCDRLIEVRAVTADGDLITANANNEHSDLFKACRGGGGGSLCIVTEFIYEPIQVDTTSFGRVTLSNFSAAADFLDAYQNFGPHADPKLGVVMSLGTRPGNPNGARAGMASVAIGDGQEWDHLMKPFLDKLVKKGVPHHVTTPSESNPAQIAITYARSNSDPQWMSCESDVPDAEHFEKTTRCKPSSVYLNEPLTSSGVDTFVSAISDRQNDSTFTNSASISMDCYGGQIAHEPEGGSVMYHRDAMAVSQLFTGGWAQNAPADYVQRNIDWLDDTRTQLANVSTNGAYVNYCDDAIEDWETAYWGPRYPFLQQVKLAYDSNDVFRFPQSIRLP
tara:strand:- start:1710 stop:3269 length:1560 start_codon:yes stop_codon:yes gene_type:complete